MDLSDFDPVLTTISFVVFLFVVFILYMGSVWMYNIFDKKENEMIEKTADQLNDAFYSSTVFDENTKSELGKVRQSLGQLENMNKEQKKITSDMDAKLLSLTTRFGNFATENSATVSELKDTAKKLPFEEQLRRIQSASQKTIEHDSRLTALRQDDIVQDEKIQVLTTEFSKLDGQVKRLQQGIYTIQGSYIPKNTMDKEYVSSTTFSAGIGELNTALAALNKTIQSMTLDYKTKEDISSLSDKNNFIIEKLAAINTGFGAIQKNYITQNDIKTAMDKEKGLLLSMLSTLDGFNQTVQDMKATLDKMPGVYVSNAQFEVIRKITTLLSSSILKVVNSSTINFDGNVGVNTTAPQGKFHVVDNTNNWCGKVVNRNATVNFATNVGNGMNIAIQGPQDGTKYGLQLQNGDSKVLLETRNDGTTYIDGNASAPVFRAKNQICINGVCLNERDLINLRGYTP